MKRLGAIMPAGVAIVLFYWLLESALHTFVFASQGRWWNLVPHDLHEAYMRSLVCGLLLALSVYAEAAMARLRRAEAERAAAQQRLAECLARALSGFIVICANCKRVREGDGWTPIEEYVRKHADVQFSHGICPTCIDALYPGMAREPVG